METWAWILLSGGIAIMIVLLLIPFRIRLRFRRHEGRNSLSVALRLVLTSRLTWEWRLLELPQDEREGEALRGTEGSSENGAGGGRRNPERERGLPTPLHMVLGAVDVLQSVLFDSEPGDARRGSPGRPMLKAIGGPLYFLRFVRVCESWHWETRLGTGDAAATAMLSGGMWGAKSCIYALLIQQVRFLQVPRFVVVPEFQHPTFDVTFDSIFRFRPGQIILMIVRDVWSKWQKGAGRFGFRQGASY